jgi:hypothetical protein
MTFFDFVPLISYPLQEPCSRHFLLFLLRRAGTIAGLFKRAFQALQMRYCSEVAAL